MENPFAKLVSEGDEPSMEENSELVPSADPMNSEEKQKRLAELREWLPKAESGEEGDKIKEEISKLESEQV